MTFVRKNEGKKIGKTIAYHRSEATVGDERQFVHEAASQTHNLKVTGSNPTPETTETDISGIGMSVLVFSCPFPAHSRMAPRSPWRKASISAQFSPGVSTMRLIRPLMAAAASRSSEWRVAIVWECALRGERAHRTSLRLDHWLHDEERFFETIVDCDQ